MGNQQRYNKEGRRKDGHGSHRRSPEAGKLVSQKCGRDHDRPRGHLSHGDPIQKFFGADPMKLIDHLVLDQGDDRKPSAKGQSPDLG